MSNVSLHYPVKYLFSKIAPIEAQQRRTKRARTEENVTAVDELVLI